MPQLLLFPDCPPVEAEPLPLDDVDRAAVLDLLLRGGSPQAACQRLGLEVAAFSRTVDEDADFRRRLRHVRELMTHNVVAVVYAAAMKGTPAAQALWLRTFPADHFGEAIELTPCDETNDDLAIRSDDEIEQEIEAYRKARFGAARSQA